MKEEREGERTLNRLYVLDLYGPLFFFFNYLILIEG